MKLPENPNRIQGNLTFGTTHAMRIHDAANGIVLNTLISLYSNPYVAALREYTSNALDSHRDAGQTAAVEVTLPTRLLPDFIVQDFGTGMSREDLYNYGQFGFSSKRDNNDAIGGYGLGSKVGLAVAASYTVTAIKDGKKNVAVIGRDKTGAPEMGLMDERDTDLPNGVTIKIPTSEARKFQEAIDNDFFLGWPSGSIKINGLLPERSLDDAAAFKPIDKLGYRIANSDFRLPWNGTRVFVDAVQYSMNWSEVGDIDQELISGYLRDVVIRLDNGSVELTPSRESLKFTATTRTAIKARVAEIAEIGKKKFIAEIEAAATRREAYKLSRKAKNYGFGKNFTWHGEPVEVRLPDRVLDLDFTWTTYGEAHDGRVQRYRELKKFSKFLSYNFEGLLTHGNDHVILVHDATDPSTVVSAAKNASKYHPESNSLSLWVKDYTTKNNIDVDEVSILVTSEPLDTFDKWFLELITLSVPANKITERILELRKERTKANRAAGVVIRKKPENSSVRIMVYRGNGCAYDVEKKLGDLDTTQKYILLQNTDGDKLTERVKRSLFTQRGYEEFRDLDYLFNYFFSGDTPRYKVIIANKGVKTSHYGDVVAIASLKDAFEQTAKELLDSKTDMELRAAIDQEGYDYGWAKSCNSNQLEKINDAVTREWVGYMSSGHMKGSSFLTAMRLAAPRLGLDFDVTRLELAKNSASPGSKYPLLRRSYSSMDRDHLLYINLIDAHREAQASALGLAVSAVA